MSTMIFWKNLLKCLPTTTTSPHPISLQQDHTHSHPLPLPTSPTSSTTPIIIKNFNSVYDLSSASTSKFLSTTPSLNSSYSDSNSDSDAEVPSPDFASIFTSQRFFFSSPGRSKSIIESHETPLNGGVAIKKYSPDPYMDFKNSMQEMIAAREVKGVREDWEYLHELLSCYLTLNPKHTHKFIISAFADTVIRLLSSSNSPETDTHRNTEDRRRHNALR